jgi:hypothetical protein
MRITFDPKKRDATLVERTIDLPTRPGCSPADVSNCPISDSNTPNPGTPPADCCEGAW